MKKWKIFLLFICLSSYKTQEADRLGILISKASVLTFEDQIVDVELGNQDYYLKIKGECLLLRAKRAQAQSTTLFVRYGKHKHYYVAEIFPDDQAPLQRVIQAEATVRPLSEERQHTGIATIFSPNQPQQYCTYGVRDDGIKVILTNITHRKESTYLRLFIENNTTISLILSHYTFAYVTTLRRFLFFTSKKRKLVDPIAAPTTIELAPNSGHYFVFAVPTYTCNGGLEVFLAELAQGEREFRLFIPSKVLLKAKRT